ASPCGVGRVRGLGGAVALPAGGGGLGGRHRVAAPGRAGEPCRRRARPPARSARRARGGDVPARHHALAPAARGAARPSGPPLRALIRIPLSSSGPLRIAPYRAILAAARPPIALEAEPVAIRCMV